MREGFALPIATLAGSVAGAVPPTFVALALPPLPEGLTFVFLVCWAVCIPLVLFLGLPLALWLRHRGQYTSGRVAVSGAIAGAVVAALVGGVALADPQGPFWQVFGSMVATGALSGLATSAAFYWAHRLMSPNNSSKPTPLRGAA